MSNWWIAFIVVEIVLLGTMAFNKIQAARRGPTSADVSMIDGIANVVLVGLAVAFALVAFTVFAWHHFRFAP